jgi:hypothetical protein
MKVEELETVLLIIHVFLLYEVYEFILHCYYRWKTTSTEH